MGKIIDYIVCSDDTEGELSITVEGLIQAGWQPFGGVAISVCQAFHDPCQCGDSYLYNYSQAMVKYEPAIIPLPDGGQLRQTGPNSFTYENRKTINE